MSQKLLEENKQLKQRMDSLDQGYLSEYGTRLESQEDQAKRAYAEAHQAGDSEKMFEAQKALSKIAIEQERYRLAKNQSEQLKKRQPEANNLLHNRNSLNKSVAKGKRLGQKRTNGLVKMRL